MASGDSHTFQCAICLELAYKPIVQACGHVFCFWCVHESMNGLPPSHCPICRSEYEHFPQMCGILHRLLARVFPAEYKKLEAEIREKEVQSKTFSPESSSSSEDRNKGEALTVEDLPCEVCKKLLWRPIVLNCGHVFCESCVPAEALHSNIPKGSYSTFSLNCLTCNMVHKYPLKVCLELDDYLQKTFPDEYKKRATEKTKPVKATTEVVDETSKSLANDEPPSSLKEDGASMAIEPREIHVGAGCDQCGMCPIQGARYKCEECPDKIGYDLCEECYKFQQQGSLVPGRFNQKHTLDHRMSKIDSSKMKKFLIAIPAGSEHEWHFVFLTGRAEAEPEAEAEAEAGEEENEENEEST